MILTLISIYQGDIGVKILELVYWSQFSNQPSQLESATATRISHS